MKQQNMQQYINTLFQQKIQEGFVEKELVKEVIKECAKNYKHEFPNGGNPLTATVFMDIENHICQLAQSRGIYISKGEVLTEITKGIFSL